MSTARLHVVGSAHEARFAEDFDERLWAAVRDAHEPDRAESELDELILLSVLSHFASAGSYNPIRPTPSWGLEAESDDPRIRRHLYAIHYGIDQVDVVVFRGIAVAPDQSVVFDVVATSVGQG